MFCCYIQSITNEAVRATITKHTKRCEELLTHRQENKTAMYGNVTRASGLSKAILQGNKWQAEKEIDEWIGKSFATTEALAHDRQRWRQLVQRSSMQRPYDPEKG